MSRTTFYVLWALGSLLASVVLSIMLLELTRVGFLPSVTAGVILYWVCLTVPLIPMKHRS